MTMIALAHLAFNLYGLDPGIRKADPCALPLAIIAELLLCTPKQHIFVCLHSDELQGAVYECSDI